ncbi:hypothetical protein ACE1SV_73720 [Streptomyces sp. E-15]
MVKDRWPLVEPGPENEKQGRARPGPSRPGNTPTVGSAYRHAVPTAIAGEVLKQEDDGELTMRNEQGVVMPRMSMWPFLPRDQAIGRVRAAS